MTVTIAVWALAVLVLLSVGLAWVLWIVSSNFINTRDLYVEARDDREFYKKRAEDNADTITQLRKTVSGLDGKLDDAAELIADQRRYNFDLRAVIDPAVARVCGCCRRCGPVVPCRGVIEAAGDGGCLGLCYCGLPVEEDAP